MYRLALRREYISLTDIKSDVKNNVKTPDAESKILEIIESLLRRSLIEKEANTSRFGQQSVVMEYINDRYIEQATYDISDINEKKNWSLLMPTP
jgi:hypothetical protein